MNIVTIEIMRRIDRIAIDEMGISGIELMHNAGEGVARVTARIFNDMELDGTIVVFTGPGNNGGDGWVVARLLNREKYNVRVITTVNPDQLKGDARTAFEEANADNIDFELFDHLKIDYENIAFAVDALLGTGAKGAPRGEIANIVRALSEFKIPTVAVDNPTGTDADTGQVEGLAVPAIATVSLCLPKIGQLLSPTREFVGELFVADIGIPDEAISKGRAGLDLRMNTPSEFGAMLPFRPSDGHKGTFGKVSIIAGSLGMTGAAALSAESALRSGSGLVELVVPEGIAKNIDSIVREVVTRPVAHVAKRGCLSVRALGEILTCIKSSDAIAFGPGIGTHRETIDLTSRLFQRITIPSVIDADGLNCIAKLKSRNIDIHFGSEVIITPHPGELSRLLDISIDEVSKGRFTMISDWARKLGVDVLVLKGSPTVIAEGEGPIFINQTGNDGMATGGSGDILTGIIAGFLAQGLKPLESARLGVFIHGLAGDMAEETLGRRAMIAGDILDSLPSALMALEEI
ncbi:NAD(P)H-hydrate dehydratase [bacterium]|nr:NAD(P)H-hydrate dehydratase [bacterium]